MRKLMALGGALLLTLLTTAPAVAAKPFATYTVAEAQCGGEPGHEWFSGGDNYHARDHAAWFETFVLIDDEWVPNGTETWVDALINVNDDHAFSANGKLQVRDSVFGDFDGIWRCNNGKACGATMKGLDDADYGHLTIKVVGQSMVEVIVPDPPDEACGVPFQDDWFAINTWTLH
jgi:hypothetical protein